MLKRYLVITLFIFSYTIVLGHSIIPHHHHKDRDIAKSADHHGHENDHHNHNSSEQDEESSGLAHDFENYFHSAERGDFHQQSGIKVSFNTIAAAYIIASFDFKISAFESPPPMVRHFNNHIPFLQRCLSSKGLRAPPCALA